MNSSRLVTNVLWILPLALQATVAFVMVRGKLLRTFPLFFAYTAVVLLRESVLLFFSYPGPVYAPIYWSGEILNIFLGLGVILETAGHLFPPYPSLKVILKVVRTLGTFAALAAILLLALSRVSTGGDRAFEIIMLAERSVRFVQTCWLILIIAFVSYFRWNWQQYSIGIAAGFGIYSALALAVFELRAHLHLVSNPTFVVLNSAAYNIAVFIWAFYFLRPRQHLQLGRLPETNLSEWNNAVTEFYAQQWYRRF